MQNDDAVYVAELVPLDLGVLLELVVVLAVEEREFRFVLCGVSYRNM